MPAFSAEAQPVEQQAAVSAAESGSLTHQMWRNIMLGNLKIEADHTAVDALILQGNIPVTYEYVATLMRTPNAFGEGPACIVCHSSNDPKRSYRGLDLSTCEGILRGATEAPVKPAIVPGEPMKSRVVQKLRNNRMPLGVSFLAPIDTDTINGIKNWIDAGAKEDDNFKNTILPLFSTPKAFGSDVACISCHSSFRDPPSFHGVNLTSYKGIMKGAFSKSNAKLGKPPVPIVIPHDAANSPLYQRLIENRMPPGIGPNDESDHPNTHLLMRWIEQGAWCK
ncbi:c-type cytochrome domain-containing protein [Candidatus Venteria ishoeyi]|nr:c-type cytochrome domain-containing protein [Candidatus Venteria ishoeyi]MDM8546124.1 c-type cytochrome domain-containing protein [Candidatus Venteria ishoeyi]